MNQKMRDDFEYIYKCDIQWDKMKDTCVLITGATGFLGSFIIKFMNHLNETRDFNITILAMVRDLEKAECILNGCTVQYIAKDICAPLSLPEKIDYIFHCASETRSIEMLEHPVEVIRGIVMGTMNILQLALEKKVKSIVYLSSMEVYGRTNQELEMVKEEDLGEINLFETRSCYPLGKRMAENLCYDFFQEYEVPVKIARLAQTFGTGVSKDETRLFGQIAKSVINHENIILHTDGSSYGNYCYVADAIAGLFLLLLKGENGEAYNISNEKCGMTILEMASLVKEQVADGTIDLIFDIPERNVHGYAPKSIMKMSAEKISSIGWKPAIEMKEMFCRMIAYLQDTE